MTDMTDPRPTNPPTYVHADQNPYGAMMMVIDNATGLEYEGHVKEINADEGWLMAFTDAITSRWDETHRVDGDFTIVWYDEHKELATSERWEPDESFNEHAAKMKAETENLTAEEKKAHFIKRLREHQKSSE